METELILDALDSVVWYNGIYEEITRLIEYIKSERGKDYITCPHEILDKSDAFTKTAWFLLVCMYGDYGTSPRSGWVEKPNEAIQFLERICKTSKEAEQV